jgi:opacity protein-like surface antigen
VTGNVQTGISKVQLDYSVSGLTNTFVIQAIDISQDIANDTVGSVNADVLVRINNHFYSYGGNGVGL